MKEFIVQAEAEEDLAEEVTDLVAFKDSDIREDMATVLRAVRDSVLKADKDLALRAEEDSVRVVDKVSGPKITTVRTILAIQQEKTINKA